MPNIDMRTILHIAGELVLFAGVGYYFQVRTRILGAQIRELQKVVEAQNQSILSLQQQVEMLMMRINGVPVAAPVVAPTPAPVRIPITRKVTPPKVVALDSDSDEEEAEVIAEEIPLAKPTKKTTQVVTPVKETSIDNLDAELAEELEELEGAAQ